MQKDELESYKNRSLENLLACRFDCDAFEISEDMSRRLRAIGISSLGELYKLVSVYELVGEAPKGIGRNTLGYAKKLCADLDLTRRIGGHWKVFAAVADEARVDERKQFNLTKQDFDSWRDGLRTELYRRIWREVEFSTQYVTVTWLREALFASLAKDVRQPPSPQRPDPYKALFGPRDIFEGSSVSFDADVSISDYDFSLASAKAKLGFRNDVLARLLKQWQGTGTERQKVICSVLVEPKVIERAEVIFFFHPTEPLRGHINIGATDDDMNKLIEAARPKKVVSASNPSS